MIALLLQNSKQHELILHLVLNLQHNLQIAGITKEFPEQKWRIISTSLYCS